jgi:murein DD-endopeptidase MepM/ murein hydrolase activator NlpD
VSTDGCYLRGHRTGLALPAIHRPSTRELCAAAATALVLAGLAWTVSAGSARAAAGGSLKTRIGAAKSEASNLAGQVSAATGQVSQLGSAIGGIDGQIGELQANLDARGAELVAVQRRLAGERVRLDRLQRVQAHAERVLARQVVDNYETPQPDIVNIVIEATGFQDVLDRVNFAHIVQQEDARVVASARAARRAVSAEAIRLGAIDAREQRIAAQVLAQRDALDRARLTLVEQQLSAIRLRSAKEIRLARTRGNVASLEQQLAQLEAATVAPASGSSQSGSGPPTPRPRSARGFTFPLPKSEASPPSTWSPDEGVDISAPGDTPEYAVCAGTIVLHGIGGFGPWAPVLHCDSPLDGYSYVYYGHAGPEHQLPIGTHVSSGEVMSSIGPGIVGISSGPHLELGFCDASGNPIGSQTASTMLSLLQAAY